MSPPEPLVLHEGETIERGLAFSAWPFYNLADREALNLVWRTTEFLYAAPEAVRRHSDVGGTELRLVGTTYVPKRQLPESE
jgi:hypothetical protein